MRDNIGGNGPAIIFALSDFFTRGTIAAYSKYQGAGLIEIELTGEGLNLRSGTVTPLIEKTVPALKGLQNANLWVLVNENTASAAEQLAIALSSRRNSYIVGQSAGMTTSNESFEITDDVSIAFSTSLMADRQGDFYPSGVSGEWPKAICGERSLIEKVRKGSLPPKNLH